MTLSVVNDLRHYLYVDLFVADRGAIMCVVFVIVFAVVVEIMSRYDEREALLRYYTVEPTDYCPNKHFNCKTYDC